MQSLDAGRRLGMDAERSDVVVIGGGPGGYAAAFRAAVSVIFDAFSRSSGLIR